MMQERPRMPVISHPTWPVQSVTSMANGDSANTSINNHIEKKVTTKTVFNGNHPQNNPSINFKTVNGPLSNSEPSCSASAVNKGGTLLNTEQPVIPDQRKIQWRTVKNLNDKDSPKSFSNLNLWLSSQKCRIEGKSAIFNSNSSSGYSNSSGFDLTKLYPELSAKLGLTKSTGETVLKGHNKTSHSNLKDLSCKNRSAGDGKSSNLNIKKLLNKSQLKGSIQYIKANGGKINIGKLQTVGANIGSLGHNANIKSKDSKANTIKLSEEKFRKLIAGQQSVSVAVPFVAVKGEAKLSCKKSKNQSVSLLEPICDKTLSGLRYPASGSGQNPNIIKILPRKPPSMPKPETLSPLQLRVHSLYQDKYAYKSDLFPLGLDHTECDNSDGDDNIDIQNFTSLSEYPAQIDAPTSDPSHSQLSLGAHRRQVVMARERLRRHEQGLSKRWALTRALLEAARANSYETASTMSRFLDDPSEQACTKRKLRNCRSSLLVPRTCVYEVDEGKHCSQKALPGTRHCVRHVTYNVDQQLFQQCSAKLEDNTLCRVPTFDAIHIHPLCETHGKNVEVTESPIITEPKPKRPRKKNKMPILSRYGKRNKKRRRSSIGSSNSSCTVVIPSTSVRPPINSPGVCLGSPQGASPLTPRTSPSFSTSCSGKADEESEFEDELEGMIGNFPLEAATRLLDTGDFQDVLLNKIPEEEITQILYDDSEPKADDQTGGGEGEKEPPPKAERNELMLPNHCPPPTDTPIGSIESIISSSFNQQELNTISQVLSNMVNDESLNLDAFPIVESSSSSSFKQTSKHNIDPPTLAPLQ